MYKLAKLDVYAIQPNPCYAWEHESDTWAEFVADLAYRDRSANECFHGLGSHVLRDNTIIGNVQAFDQIDKPIRQVTLTEFLATADPLDEALDACDGEINLV